MKEINVNKLCILIAVICLFIAFLTVAGSLAFLWPTLAWVLLAGVAYGASMLV